MPASAAWQKVQAGISWCAAVFEEPEIAQLAELERRRGKADNE